MLYHLFGVLIYTLSISTIVHPDVLRLSQGHPVQCLQWPQLTINPATGLQQPQSQAMQGYGQHPNHYPQPLYQQPVAPQPLPPHLSQQFDQCASAYRQPQQAPIINSALPNQGNIQDPQQPQSQVTQYHGQLYYQYSNQHPQQFNQSLHQQPVVAFQPLQSHPSQQFDQLASGYRQPQQAPIISSAPLGNRPVIKMVS